MILFISICFDFQDILSIFTHKEHTHHDQNELQQNMDSIVAGSMMTTCSEGSILFVKTITLTIRTEILADTSNRRLTN
jgi:hypothetical protein